MTKPGRIPCEVLTCRRTAPADKYPPRTKICCGKCWRLGRPEDRKAHLAAWKILAPTETLSAEEWAALPVEQKRSVLEAIEAANRAFNAIVAIATQARAGIG